ncbi:MAG: retroviral-like aspartic protease family protein [Candidatus Nitrosoglobus sp.]|jgi:predicted aspartyl protease
MKRSLTKLVIILWLITAAQHVVSKEFDTIIAMQEKSSSTYYVHGNINGYGAVEFMVDTGSGYLTINEETLSILKQQKRAHYVKDLKGVLADGREMKVPVYLINAIRIGKDCWLSNVEAAVFPGRTRYILGLSALQMAAPFIFSIDPPQLILSHCKNIVNSQENTLSIAN